MRNRSVFHAVLPILVLLPALATAGMVALEDEALSEFTGEGIAIVLEDFRFQMKNTGYIEQIGTAPATGAGFQRGDMRWYGLTVSGAGAADGLGWTGEACGHSLCPIANTGATIAPFDNPYMLRVFDKTGWDFQNASVTETVLEVIGPTNSDAYRWAFWGEAEVGKSGSTNTGLLQSQTMIVGKPVSSTTYTESGYTVTTTKTTTSTTVTSCGFLCTNYTTTTTTDTTVDTYTNNVKTGTSPTTTTTNNTSGSGNGGCGGSGTPRTCNPAPTTTTSQSATTTTNTVTPRGTTFRIFQNQNNGDRSIGFTFAIALSGDFRFSLAQTSTSADTLGQVPLFDNGTTADNAPGLKFRNVKSWIPLGQLFYQSLIFDDTRTDATAGNGNFVIELTQLPNQANAYNDFYSYAGITGGTPGAGCTDARYTGVNCGYQRTERPSRYFETHGYSRWGDWYPGNGANCGAAGTLCNTFNSTSDGIIFTKAGAAPTFTATASRPDTTASQDSPPPTVTQTRTGLSSVNIGDSRIEGILFQHIKITTLGAGP